MASARGRKTTQQGRRSQKKRRPQSGRRQKSHSRRSLAKQKKHQGQAKHQLVQKQKKKTLKRSSKTKKLNQMKQGGRFLSHQAKGLMISFMEDIYKQVSIEAERLRRQNRDPLISPEHVQAALQRLVPKRRWKHFAALSVRIKH